MTGKTIMTLTVACLATGLGGCVTTRGDLQSSADRLERNAQILAENAPEASGYADRGYADHGAYSYSREAHELAVQAREFRETVAERGTDDRDVKAAFERLSRRYHDLRDDVDRSESRRAQDDLRPVTEAYLDVERQMGGYPDSHRYAREREVPDRY